MKIIRFKVKEQHAIKKKKQVTINIRSQPSKKYYSYKTISDLQLKKSKQTL